MIYYIIYCILYIIYYIIRRPRVLGVWEQLQQPFQNQNKDSNPTFYNATKDSMQLPIMKPTSLDILAPQDLQNPQNPRIPRILRIPPYSMASCKLFKGPGLGPQPVFSILAPLAPPESSES